MPILLRPITTRMFRFLYILGIVSSIVTIPDSKNAEMYWNAPWELFLDIYVLCAIVCILPRQISYKKVTVPLRFIVKIIIYCFTYPLYIIDTFCFIKYGTTITPAMVLLVGETNGNEATEFFSSYLSLDLLCSSISIILLIILTHISCALYFHYKPVRWHIKPDKKYSKASNITVAAVLLVSLLLSVDNKRMYCKTMMQDTIGNVENTVAVEHDLNIYQPFMRLCFAIRCNELIAKQLVRLEQNVGNVRVDSCSVKSPNIILIIGESSCKRHFQIYGYEKPNTPYQTSLQRSGNIIRMDDVVSPWNITSYVFKHLMTTYCIGDDKEWCDYPLFCEIFRKAGYHVKFFSNQWNTRANQALYDFSGGFFLNNEKLSHAQFDERNSYPHKYDYALLTDYQKTLPDKEQQCETDTLPHLNIFHLIGEHLNYNMRYPVSFKKFQSWDYKKQEYLSRRERMIMADYDNAVLYNDYIVYQIIERFKDKDAIIVYISDHGEEVFGPGAPHTFGRTHYQDITKWMAEEEFSVPMLFYVSDKYKSLHPDVVKAIKAARKKKYMTDALSHLLLGLAGIHCPYYRPQYDLLSPQYNENRKRILRNTTDYDTLK